MEQIETKTGEGKEEKGKIKIFFSQYLYSLLALFLVLAVFSLTTGVFFGYRIVRGNWVSIWLPSFLSIIVSYFVFYRRLQSYRLFGWNRQIAGIYTLLFAVLLAIPSYTMMKLVRVWTNPIVSVNTLEEWKQHPKNGLFSVKNLRVDTSSVSCFVDYEDPYFFEFNQNIDLYFVAPILPAQIDTLFPQPVAWLACRHTLVCSVENQSDYIRQFVKSTIFNQIAQFKNRNFNSIPYIERCVVEPEKQYYLYAAGKNKHFPPRGMIFEIRDNPQGSLYPAIYTDLFASILIGAIVLVILVLSLQPQKHRIRLKVRPEVKADKPQVTGSSIMNRFDYYIPEKSISMVLVILLLGVALVQITTSGYFWYLPDEILLKTGGMYLPALQEGQWWRLITSYFIYDFSPILVANCVLLAVWVSRVEPVVSKLKMIICFFACGAVSVWAGLSNTPDAVVCASNGAVAGLAAAAWLITYLYPGFPEKTKTNLFVELKIFGGGLFIIYVGFGNSVVGPLVAIALGFVLAFIESLLTDYFNPLITFPKIQNGKRELL